MNCVNLLRDLTAKVLMHLDYSLSGSWDKDPSFLTSANESDLRHYAFPGDIILRKEQTDLSTDWGWVQLVDFALGLRGILKTLEFEGGTEAELEFTESDATLRFDRHGHEVLISGSYAPGNIVVPLIEFKKQISEFARRLDAELVSKQPDLLENTVYQAFKLSGLSD
jgi:hypothetical protein